MQAILEISSFHFWGRGNGAKVRLCGRDERVKGCLKTCERERVRPVTAVASQSWGKAPCLGSAQGRMRKRPQGDEWAGAGDHVARPAPGEPGRGRQGERRGGGEEEAGLVQVRPRLGSSERSAQLPGGGRSSVRAKERATTLAWSWRLQRRYPRRLGPGRSRKLLLLPLLLVWQGRSCAGLGEGGRGPEPAKRSATSGCGVAKCTERCPGFRRPTLLHLSKAKVGGAPPWRGDR